MRNSNRRLIATLLPELAQSAAAHMRHSQDLYNVTSNDLRTAEEEVLRCEHEWRQGGAIRVTGPELEVALQRAEELQAELNRAKARSRPGITLTYLKLVRLFVLTRLPQYGKLPVIGGFGAIICAFFLLLSPLFFPSLRDALLGTFVLTLICFSIGTVIILALWPTESKRQSFQRLQHELKRHRERMESLRSPVAHAWSDYNATHRDWKLWDRLLKARQKRDELAALISSRKYQLIHTDWRSLRGDDFERFLALVFETLGYQVELTKGSSDQGADLIVTGKGKRIAVQAKGYADSVGNHAVMEVVAGMTYYRCDSCAVITNSRFTPAAKALAAANACRLIDGSQIPDLIEGLIY